MNYSIYGQNGQILRVVATNDILSQLHDGENYLDGIYLDTEYYVDVGVPVLLPPRPNEFCVFDYDTKQWRDPRTPTTQWAQVRVERTKRLAACDWTQLGDISAQTKALWEPYRQALRDITNQPDPFDIVWPTPPQ